MDTFLVQNTSDLNGCIEISGSKNACLPLLAAATLLKNNITFHDIPNICDVYSFLDILKLLKVDCICACPRSMFLRSLLLTRVAFFFGLAISRFPSYLFIIFSF